MADPRSEQETHMVDVKFIIQKIRKLPKISRDLSKEIKNKSEWYNLSIRLNP